MSSVLVDQVLRGLWVGASTGMVRYGRAGNGYGMVLQDMVMGWYGLVCGTVFFGTVWYGRVPVSTGMWYGIFLVRYRMAGFRYRLVCGTFFLYGTVWSGI